jgi:hypothetical protein
MVKLSKSAVIPITALTKFDRVCKTFFVCSDAYCSGIYKRLKNPKIAFEFLGHGSQGIGIWDKAVMNLSWQEHSSWPSRLCIVPHRILGSSPRMTECRMRSPFAMTLAQAA